MSRTGHSSADGVRAHQINSNTAKKAQNLPEEYTEQEPSCNKHVCLEDEKRHT